MAQLFGSANPIRRYFCSAAVLCGLGTVAWQALLLAPGAFAQQPQAQRVVQGKVVDKADAALKGAVVYLKDGHTLAVKSYIAGDDGSYRFSQLAQNTDYSLWAESDGKKSAVKNISSFDTKVEFNITLKIEK
jgi:hypothetical protein